MGYNLHPTLDSDAFIEFDSMINLRPSWGNRSRGVDDPHIQAQIRQIVQRLVQKMIIHKGLHERWHQFSLAEQLANVGTDVERAIRWKEKNNPDFSQKAFERSLELLDFNRRS